MKNTGGEAGEFVYDQTGAVIRLEAGAEVPISFTMTKTEPAIYTITVGGQSTNFTVLRPASITVKEANVDKSEVKPGEDVVVTATVFNSGEITGTYTVKVTMDGVDKDSATVTVEGGKTVFKTFKVSS